MTKKDYLEKELLGEMERLEQKFLPGKSAQSVKGCLGGAFDLIRQSGDDDFDFGFFEGLEEVVNDALFNCSDMKDLSAPDKIRLTEELELIFKALDYKYSWGEPEEAMMAEPEEFDAAESIEPPWDDEDDKG